MMLPARPDLPCFPPFVVLSAASTESSGWLTLGFVNSANDFLDQPKVINGCSELFADVFGMDNGVGARSALPSNTLPGGIAVEIEMIVETYPE